MEKLWTVAEVARYLGLDEAAVESLVREGRLTGYQLGGQYLRFRPDQVKALRGKVTHGAGSSFPSKAGSSGWTHRAREFFYFYDFYIISAILLAFLLGYLMVTG